MRPVIPAAASSGPSGEKASEAAKARKHTRVGVRKRTSQTRTSLCCGSATVAPASRRPSGENASAWAFRGGSPRSSPAAPSVCVPERDAPSAARHGQPSFRAESLVGGRRLLAGADEFAVVPAGAFDAVAGEGVDLDPGQENDDGEEEVFERHDHGGEASVDRSVVGD